MVWFVQFECNLKSSHLYPSDEVPLFDQLTGIAAGEHILGNCGIQRVLQIIKENLHLAYCNACDVLSGSGHPGRLGRAQKNFVNMNLLKQTMLLR